MDTSVKGGFFSMYQLIFLVERGIKGKLMTCNKCNIHATYGANKGENHGKLPVLDFGWDVGYRVWMDDSQTYKS